ncbi:M24 family metallopeptidase [Gorillibacterium sp. sgz5001074]|uniref:M24 family metallopeptidase n=1 Tax=Gorillibacterium sp. sgz5001074 TaxID=3446695 RepID=UPI003F66B871
MTQSRLVKLRKELEALQLDALLVTNSYNRRYMTGFTGTSGYVLITSGEAYFLTDFRYMTQAAQQAPDYKIVEHKAKPMETVKELLDGLGIGRLGFEQQDVSYGLYKSYGEDLEGIELVPTTFVVEKLRMIKDEQELSVMQEAADLADAAFTHILGYLKPGVSELEIALELEFFLRRNGATSTSFDTIIASGERSALPHGVASERKLGMNEFVKMDFGALYKGYCSDITRTVVLGQPTDKHREIYGIVKEAQETCLAGLRPGMTGAEGDALARDVIKKAGYGDRFGHGTGHSFGLQIHENPRLSPTCDVVLQPGMTVTVEPGIYLPGFGGVRIEDDVVMTETGIRVLTHSTKELLLL